MTKKLIAFLFCLTITATLAQAQQRNAQAKQAAITRATAAKISNAKFENSLKVTLFTIYDVYDEMFSSRAIEQRETICSAVFINPQGDLAIKNDCWEVFFSSGANSSLKLMADMDHLGRGADFFTEIKKVNYRLASDQKTYVTFPLGKYLSVPAKKKLAALFKTKGVEKLPPATITRILESMSKSNTLTLETYF